METEHLIWVGVSFAISLFLVWMVWSFFCGERSSGKGGDASGDDREDSESFSSTVVITGSGNPKKMGKRKRRFKRATMNDHSSTNDNTTTDDESAIEENGTGRNNNKRPRRKSRRDRRESSYQYKENSYGLHDPFSEWAPKIAKFRDPTMPVVHNYPKSPSAPRKPHLQINLS